MKIYIKEKDGSRVEEHDLPILRIGRGKDNEIVISDRRASRHHCRILSTPEGAFLEDLQSRNGTFIGGERVTRRKLHPGDTFKIGTTRFTFERDPRGESATAGAQEGGAVAAAARARSTPPAPPPDVSVVRAGDVYLEGLGGDHAGERIPITKVPYTIGRKPMNDFRLTDRKTSSRHARIVRRGEVFWVEDLDSRNGTYVNGKPVKESPLVPGCRLQIGALEFLVHVPEAAGVRLEDAVFADAAVGADVVGEDEFSHFDVNEFLRDREGAGQQPLLLVMILLMTAALLYLTVDITLSRLQRRRPDPSPEANRVAANWSFELDPREDGSIPGWTLLDPASGSLSLSDDEGVQWPGRRALLLDASTGGIGIVAAATEPIPVDEASSYYLAGAVLNRGAYAAGLMVAWLRESPEGVVEIGRSFSRTVRAAGDDDEIVRLVFPPRSATSARVACFVLTPSSGAGSAAFDRVFFGQEPPPWFEEASEELAAGGGNEAVGGDEEGGAGAAGGAEGTAAAAGSSLEEPLELIARPGDRRDVRDAGKPLRAVLEPEGDLTAIRRRSLSPVARLGAGLPLERDPLAIGVAMSETDSRRRGGEVQILSQVADVEGEDWVPVEMRVEVEGDAIDLRYRFGEAWNSGSVPETIAVRIGLSSARVPRSAFDEGGGIVEIGARPAGPVRELVFGTGAEQIVLQFAPAVRMRLAPAAAGRARPIIEATAASSERPEIEVVISPVSGQEEIAFRGQIDRARALGADGKIVEAIAVLDQVRARYSWRDLTGVERLRKELLGRARRAAKELGGEVELLEWLGSPIVYRAIRARVERLQTRFAGLDDVTARIASLARRADAIWAGTARGDSQARRLFDLGEKRFRGGEIHLAELCLREARELGGSDEELVRRVGEILELIEIKKRGEANGPNP